MRQNDKQASTLAEVWRALIEQHVSEIITPEASARIAALLKPARRADAEVPVWAPARRRTADVDTYVTSEIA